MKRILLAVLLIAASVCAGWHAHSAREEVKMRNLKATDPELAALWENFVDNDVRPHGSLDARTRQLFCWRGMLPPSRRTNTGWFWPRRWNDGVVRSRPKRPCIRQFPMSAWPKLTTLFWPPTRSWPKRGFNCLWKDSRGRRRKIVWKKDWPPKRKSSAHI